MTELNASVRNVDMPGRIRWLPIDARGFPVPWFVAWFKDGEQVEPGVGLPDFRVADANKMRSALKLRLCWVCGKRLGRHLAFTIGPMCAINRTMSEPPSHYECARFAAQACPF